MHIRYYNDFLFSRTFCCIIDRIDEIMKVYNYKSLLKTCNSQKGYTKIQDNLSIKSLRTSPFGISQKLPSKFLNFTENIKVKF